MKVNKVKMALSTLLIVAVAVPVFVYAYSQAQQYAKQISTVIVVRYPSPAQFGVYWDYDCTQPVTAIDFGGIPQPKMTMYLSRSMYIRNEQVGERIWIYWNSTLHTLTNQISESWISNGTSLEPGAVTNAYYYLYVYPNISVGTYNWTLGVWAEY